MKRVAGTIRLSEQPPELRRVIEALLAQRTPAPLKLTKKAAPGEAAPEAAGATGGTSDAAAA